MTRGLTYVPTDGAVLFHYCSPDSLLAILEFRTLRLTDVSEMNDALELRWGVQVLEQEIARREGLPEPVVQALLGAVDEVENGSVALACCFSTQGDVLSQWRAYADNGAGFSIAIDPKELSPFPVKFLEVSYDPSAQQNHVSSAIDELVELYEDDFVGATLINSGQEEDESFAAMSVLKKLEFYALYAIAQLLGFKNPAFSEESEVRLLHLAHVDRNADRRRIRLVNCDDDSVWADGRRPQIGFLMRGSVPICHIDMPIPKAAIKEIVIGPRAIVREETMARLLGTLGYEHVSIRRSVASYR